MPFWGVVSPMVWIKGGWSWEQRGKNFSWRSFISQGRIIKLNLLFCINRIKTFYIFLLWILYWPNIQDELEKHVFLIGYGFHPFLYDFYLTLQNPQAYCVIFLTRIAYPLTVLFLKNYKLSWLWANQLLWKFLFALCLPIFRSLGGA